MNGDLARRTFTVRVGELRAAILFASNDETRFVLNSVRIEFGVGKHPVMIATDGRRLAAIESVADQGENLAEVDFDVTIATSFLKPLVAFAKSQSAEIQFEYRPADRLLCHFVGGKTFLDCEEGAIIHGDYPNWRQALPKGAKQSVPHIGVNAELVGDFAKAAKFLDCDTPIISVNLIGKSDAMEVRIDSRPQFYGVLMPAKIDEDKEWQPEFLELIGFRPEPTEPEEDESGEKE